MSNIKELLETFPRTRPKLSPGHKVIYEKEYYLNREGEKTVEKLAKKLESWMHINVASNTNYPSLELGAGTLNHLKFESTINEYDIVEPFVNLYKNSDRLYLVNKKFKRLSDIPEDKKYKRIFSIAVLEHMTNLPKEISLCCKLMDRGGVFQAGIPSEGGFLWWLGWRSTTAISYFFRNGLDYGELMKHEHINSAKEIIKLIKYFFEDVKIKRFPTSFHHLSFYVYIEAKKPILKRLIK